MPQDAGQTISSLSAQDIQRGVELAKTYKVEKPAVGTFTATGAALGAPFGGVGAVIGAAIGAVVDGYFLFARPATETIGWARANAICSPIADQVTADLKANLTEQQFTELAAVIEDRAVELLKELEKDVIGQDAAQRVLRYIQDILTEKKNIPDNFTRVRSTIWRFLMQRVEYFAVADVSSGALGTAIAHRLRVLVYDWLTQKGYVVPVRSVGANTGGGTGNTGESGSIPVIASSIGKIILFAIGGFLIFDLIRSKGGK